MSFKRLTINLSIACLSLILLCILLELIFRLPAVKQKTGGNNPALFKWYNSIHVNQEINSWGFRDLEHQSDKLPNTFRIVVLGDSVAYGQMLAPQLAFPRLLEDHLNQSSSKKFEVINLSLMGWNTVEELQGLKQFGVQLKPDLIIIAFHLNDLQVKPNPIDQEVFDRERPIVPLASVDTYLDQHSYLYSFIRFRYNRLLEKLGKKIDYATWQRYPYSQNSRGFIDFQQALTQMKKISDQIQSDILWVSLNFEPSWEKELILAVSVPQSLSIPTLDMFPFFKQFNPVDLQVSPSDWHPNKTAHQIYARVLANYIKVHYNTSQ